MMPGDYTPRQGQYLAFIYYSIHLSPARQGGEPYAGVPRGREHPLGQGRGESPAREAPVSSRAAGRGSTRLYLCQGCSTASRGAQFPFIRFKPGITPLVAPVAHPSRDAALKTVRPLA